MSASFYIFAVKSNFEYHSISYRHMKKFIIAAFCLVMGTGLMLPLQAQVNPSQVNVNELSDAQIRQIAEQVKARGLSMDQAAALARAQGASEAQVATVMRRIQELSFSQGTSTTQAGAQGFQPFQFQDEPFSPKAEAVVSEKARKIFGYSLFNSDNLTFEPSVNIPTPKNYVMGIGDELVINVWGASQNVYNLTVDQNGNIQIPDVGPVNVKGMNFEDARSLIKRRLMSIYSGMAGSYPNTWAEVSLNNLRSIKVSVAGEALVPGTYTLPATASVFNALYLSGGPGENGSFRNVQLLRDNQVIATIDVYDFLINGNTAANVTLREQDILFIPTYTTRVETKGNFKRNNFFELKESETMADLLKYAGGFGDDAWAGQVSVERITETQRRVSDVSSDLFDSFLLKNGDVVTAGNVIDRYENRISIEGAVFRPGIYELTDGMKLSGLIQKAGGLKEDVFSNRGLIVRLQDDLTPMNLSFNVEEVMRGVGDIPLKREDAVVIQGKEDLRQERFVRILGQVQAPGSFEYRDNMTLRDLIFMARGFTEAASESYLEVSRRNSYTEASELTPKMVTIHRFDIGRDLKLDAKEQNFVLQPFDYVYVRRAPSYFEQQTVMISGEVMYPGDYSIVSKDEKISDVLQRAGGLTTNAYVKGAYMRRAPRDAEQMESTLALLAEDSLLESTEARLHVEKMELRLEEILKNPNSIYNYELKAGDEIVIPEVTEEIRVAGEILNPIALAYEPGKSAKYYIEKAGGFSQKAKKGKVYVIHSNGTAQVTKNFIFHNYPKVQQGSQVVVPMKPERTGTGSEWVGIAGTMSTMAVAIAALIRVL